METNYDIGDSGETLDGVEFVIVCERGEGCSAGASVCLTAGPLLVLHNSPTAGPTPCLQAHRHGSIWPLSD